MKCDELKKLLEDKDVQVKEIRDNTIEIFNQTKDLILSDFVKRFIDNEFKTYHYISSSNVYNIILDNAGIEHDALMHDSAFFLIRSLDYPHFMVVKPHKREQYDTVKSFIDKFDYKLFGKMLEKYLFSKGFSNAYIKNIYGQKVKTSAFEITRKDLERNLCCNKEKTVDRNEGINTDTLKGVVGLIALAAIIFCLVLAFGGK